MAENLGKSSVPSTESHVGKRVKNLVIVAVAITLSIALFIGLRSENNSASLNAIANESMPLEVAVSNGKPTLMEFYADWCNVCQAMAPDIAQLEHQYADSVNFVMLNVDNSKWLPEILKYRVDGIPHFVFLNQSGEAIAQAIGEQPRNIMATNIEALLAGSQLPYAQASGQVSKFNSQVKPSSGGNDPRLHGSQVVN